MMMGVKTALATEVTENTENTRQAEECILTSLFPL